MCKNLKVLAIICFSIVSFNSKILAQSSPSVNGLVTNGPSDATKLAKAYFSPGLKGIGFGMNGGWYSSAKAKNLGRFDIRIEGTAAFIPTADQSFNINSLGLSKYTQAKNTNISPTMFGTNQAGANISLKDDNENEAASFTLPASTGIKFAPSPQIQLTVGIIKNTDISVRYSPKIGSEQGNFGTIQVLGFGAKHEITRLIFGKKAAKIIPFDLALAFGYNQIDYNYKLPIDKQINDKNPGTDLNQRASLKLSGYSIDAIFSKKLAFFTPFASLAYNSSTSELNVLGDYTFETGYNGIPPTGNKTYTTFTDPVIIKQNDISGLRANIGFELHLAIFRLYGAYSIGQYSAFTGGIGLGIGH